MRGPQYVVTQEEPSIAEYIREANADFDADLKHHLEWLEQQRAGAGKERAAELVAQLQAWINKA